jgi:hypothetical protein
METSLATSNFVASLSASVAVVLALVSATGCGLDFEEGGASHEGPTSSQIGFDGGKPDAGLDGASDGGADAGGGPYTSGVTCNDRIAPTTANVATILQRSCGLASSCHAGIAAQAGLDLSTIDAIFRTAVDYPSSQVSDLSVIASEKPEQSYLLRKLRNTQMVGTAMPPPPSARFCDAKVTAIEAWIRDGAKR